MNIVCDLSTASLQHAAKLVRNYADDVKKKTQETVSKVCNAGYEVATATAHVESGELVASIDSRVEGNGIEVNCKHAAFHEFGTGVVGNGTYPGKLPGGWNYDVNNHGKEGWWYFDKKQNRRRWTAGQRGTAFMAKAAEAMRQEVIPAAREAFS